MLAGGPWAFKFAEILLAEGLSDLVYTVQSSL